MHNRIAAVICVAVLPIAASSTAMAQFPGPPPGPPPAFAGPPPGGPGPGPGPVARGLAAGAVGAGVAAGAAAGAYASDDYYGCSRRYCVRVYDAYSDSYVYRCR